MTNEWDLGAVLSERVQPSDTVEIYLNEAASYTKAQLMKAHAKATPEQVTALDEELIKVEDLLEKSKYTVHLTASPSRMRENIHSKALHKYPLKRDPIWGHDDPANEQERNVYENNLIWEKHITNVVNPDGASKTDWTFEEIVRFADALPTKVQQGIDMKIKELNEAAEEYTLGSKSVDFSLKS